MSIPLNELVQSPIFVGAYFTAVIGVVLIALANKYVIMGIKLLMMRPGGKHGLLFLKNKAGNLGMPHFVSLSADEYKIKRKGVSLFYGISRKDFEGPKFFGFPFTIKDSDDAGRSYGLYAPEYDKDGNPLKDTVTVEGKTYETTADKLTSMKDGYRVDPETFDGIIAKHKMLDGLKDMVNKNQVIFMAVIGCIVLTVVSLYLNYESHTLLNETVLPLLKEAVKNNAPTIIGG